MGACVSIISPSSSRSKALQPHKEAAIHRLHPEILSEIFLFCLPGDQFVVPDPLQAPLLVCGICQSWREICLSTPKLWCSLNILGAPRSPRNTLIETWLDRSGAMPLSIGFDVWPHAPDLEAMLFRYIDRWQHIRWYEAIAETEDSDIPSWFQNLRTPCAPLLETFDFVNDDIIAHCLRKQLDAILMSAPRLHTYHFSSVFTSDSFRVPWTQLTEMAVLFDMTAKECIEILRQCTQLVKCSIGNILLQSTHLAYFPAQPRVVLDDLQSLSISSLMEDIAPLLDHLVLRGLKRFEFVYDIGYDVELERILRPRWKQESFLYFLTRSSCSLESLKLSDVTMTQEQLIECLRCTPSLVALEIDNCRMKELTRRSSYVIKDTVLELLTCRPLSRVDDAIPCLCPNLQNIRLDYCINCSYGVLADMIESRYHIDSTGCDSSANSLPAVATLQHVSLKHLNRPRHDINRLAKLKGEGLDLTLHWI